MSISSSSASLTRLLEIMARLRGPAGCPWDAAQTPESLTPYLLEEAHEVLEAIGEGDPAAVCDELGDLLLQVVFQARIFEERGHFDMAAVCEAIADKLVRRHPHVFAGQKEHDPKKLDAQWERIKAEEKGPGPSGLLDGIPKTLSALQKARKVSERASRVGFDWPDLIGILDKVREECDELEQALAEDRGAVESEFGDLLFSLVNFGRFIGIDAESALDRTVFRFRKRFHHLETSIKSHGQTWEDYSPEDLNELWEEAKELERRKNPLGE